MHKMLGFYFFFFFTLVTGSRRSLNLKLSDTRVYEPQIRARLGTTAGLACMHKMLGFYCHLTRPGSDASAEGENARMLGSVYEP